MKVLYKYRGNNTYTDEIISASTLYAASPDEFNDPFDCKAPISFTCTDSEFKLNLVRVLKKHDPGLSRHDLRAHVKNVMRDKALVSQWKKDIIPEVQKRISDLGIICLTEKNDDILMWSHYAECHRGICLEIDIDIKGIREYAKPMKYSDNFPQLNYFRDEDEDIDDGVVYLKSKAWEYEKEWRLLKRHDKPRQLKVPEAMLTGIIFGCQTSDHDKSRYASLIKHRKTPVKLYQASKRENSFALDIELI